MLNEPDQDPVRLELDLAIAKAVAARQEAGARPTPDADAIALRGILKGLSPSQKSAVRAVMGRMEAGLGRPLMACGGMSQLLVADRWGPAARPVPDTDQALQAACRGARVLVDIGQHPWWGKVLALPELNVIAALPDDGAGRPRTLMLSTETPGPTGDDRTFWVTDSTLDDAAIVEALSHLGLASSPLAASGGLKLFVLEGYVQAEDIRLAEAPGTLRGVIGASPVF